LGALEDIQLVKPEPAPPFGELAPAGEPAPPPQLASPAEEVALSEELLPPEEPDPSSPYGTGWSMEEEAGGLYSFHGSMNYLHPGARTIYSRRTLMDSLGNEHAVEMEVVPYERSSIALASTDPSTYPQLKITFKREDGVLSIKDTGSTGLSCALDEATERLVVTFMDTGAQLTLDMSDAQATSSQDYPGASHGETVLWDMPPMIFEEATYKVRQLGPVYSEATIGGLHWTPGITVERSQDGLFAGLFSGISFKIELRFNEEGRVSGYKFTQNGGSTEDPSVGVEQTGPLIEGAHFVYNDTDYGTFNIDLSLVQIVVKTEPTPPEPEAIPEEVVPAGAAKGKILEKTEVGFAPLSPSSLSIDENGVLKRLKDDGDWEPVYLLACGQFAAMNAAEERNGVYYATPASGALRTGVSGKDGMGTVTSGTLERSTTDLAHELSEMIRAQHAYAANTKVLSTIEDMLTELERL
jgi:hypothetical protein